MRVAGMETPVSVRMPNGTIVCPPPALVLVDYGENAGSYFVSEWKFDAETLEWAKCACYGYPARHNQGQARTDALMAAQRIYFRRAFLDVITRTLLQGEPAETRRRDHSPEVKARVQARMLGHMFPQHSEDELTQVFLDRMKRPRKKTTAVEYTVTTKAARPVRQYRIAAKARDKAGISPLGM